MATQEQSKSEAKKQAAIDKRLDKIKVPGVFRIPTPEETTVEPEPEHA